MIFKTMEIKKKFDSFDKVAQGRAEIKSKPAATTMVSPKSRKNVDLTIQDIARMVRPVDFDAAVQELVNRFAQQRLNTLTQRVEQVSTDTYRYLQEQQRQRDLLLNRQMNMSTCAMCQTNFMSVPSSRQMQWNGEVKNFDDDIDGDFDDDDFIEGDDDTDADDGIDPFAMAAIAALGSNSCNC